MCVGRQVARRVFQDHISTDARVWAVGVKADAFTEQLSTVFESCDFVVEPFVRKGCIEQLNLSLCGSMAASYMGTV